MFIWKLAVSPKKIATTVLSNQAVSYNSKCMKFPGLCSSMIKIQKPKSGHVIPFYPEMTISNKLVYMGLETYAFLHQFITSYSYKSEIIPLKTVFKHFF